MKDNAQTREHATLLKALVRKSVVFVFVSGKNLYFLTPIFVL